MGLDQLEYVLNRMLNAAQSTDPAKAGYAEARKELLAGIAARARRIRELETQLGAWHEAFGTTQLTHALARLEAAEAGQRTGKGE